MFLDSWHQEIGRLRAHASKVRRDRLRVRERGWERERERVKDWLKIRLKNGKQLLRGGVGAWVAFPNHVTSCCCFPSTQDSGAVPGSTDQ